MNVATIGTKLAMNRTTASHVRLAASRIGLSPGVRRADQHRRDWQTHDADHARQVMQRSLIQVELGRQGRPDTRQGQSATPVSPLRGELPTCGMPATIGLRIIAAAKCLYAAERRRSMPH